MLDRTAAATGAARALAAVRRPDGLFALTQGSSCTAQTWTHYGADNWGKTVLLFDPRHDRPPAADVMIAVDEAGNVVGCVMAEDFRRGARKRDDGVWWYGPVHGPWATWSLAATCTGCRAETTPFFDSNRKAFFCSLECMHADRE